MARVNLLETRTANFGDLMSSSRTYRVPPFQRDYSWEAENWEDLWRDILALRDDPESSHYMGAVVLQSQDEKEFTIIDGQQRFATLSLVAIAVLQKIEELAQRNIEPDANRERQRILRRTFLGDKDPRSLRYSSKLFLNENNDDFYQSFLLQLRTPLNTRTLSRSNRLLWDAFRYFVTELSKLGDVVSSGESLAAFLTDIVASQLLFIQINVENELNAYTVFETLNARGVELSATDLLKNYLLSLARSKLDLEHAQRQWRRIIDTVQSERFPEFLRYYLSLQQRQVRRERLFKIMRESVHTDSQGFKLLDELELFSELFVALSDPSHDLWRDSRENRRHIRELTLFRVRQAYPVLFAANWRMSPHDFTRVLKLIAVISFRYNMVSGLNPNELESVYNDTAMKLVAGQINSPLEVFDSLRSVYVSDQKFATDFASMVLSTAGQKKRLVRYVLYRLEADLSGSSEHDYEDDPATIEHIFPENPPNGWFLHFENAAIQEACVYRLGNYTLIESHLNREIGNSDYSRKRDIFQASTYALTREIDAPEWTPNTIAARQEWMAKRAVHIWRADFA